MPTLPATTSGVFLGGRVQSIVHGESVWLLFPGLSNTTWRLMVFEQDLTFGCLGSDVVM